jgi:hypothetical protein
MVALQQGLDVTTSDQTATSFDLSILRSRIQEIQAARDSTADAVNSSSNIAIALFGHDRNPWIEPLRAQDSLLVPSGGGGGFSIGWPYTGPDSSAMSDAEFTRQAEQFAKLIPDLSYMLSDGLSLPPDQR